MIDTEKLDLLAKIASVKIETKAEECLEDASLRRFKDKVLFLTTIGGLGCMYIACAYVLFTNSGTPMATIALNGVIALTSALAGYYVRGKS